MVVRDALAEALSAVLTPVLVKSIVATLPASASVAVGSLDVVAGYDLLRRVGAGARIFTSTPSRGLLDHLRERMTGGRPFLPTLQTVPVSSDHDVITVQDTASKLVRGLFKPTDCVRTLTAVSELARNIYLYAGTGEVRLQVSEANYTVLFQVEAADRGPGITQLDQILAGAYRSRTGLGRGLLGAKALLEDLDIQTGPRGTTVRGQKRARLSETLKWTP